MTFKVCQDVAFAGTTTLKGTGPNGTDSYAVSFTQPVCGDAFEQQDEAMASFKAKLATTKANCSWELFSTSFTCASAQPIGSPAVSWTPSTASEHVWALLMKAFATESAPYFDI